MKPALFLIVIFLILIEFLSLLFWIPNYAIAKEENTVKVAVTIDEHLSYSVTNDQSGNKLNVSTNSENGFLVMSLDGNLNDYSNGPSQKSYNLNSNSFIILANF